MRTHATCCDPSHRTAAGSREWIAPRPGRSHLSGPHEDHAPASRASGHDFGRVAVETRNPEELDGGAEVLTKGEEPAAPTPPAPTPTPTPKAPAKNCGVRTGPTYTPSPTVPVTTAGGRKKAKFTMAATFDTDAGTGKTPSCCEVRQFIKWDKAFHDWMGGPPHGGFPSGTKHDTWIEDRDSADTRYGHRSGTHSSPVAACGDEYKKGATRNMANGDTYCGKDGPSGPDTMKGQFQFRLDVIASCDGGTTKTSSPVITIDWS